MAGVETFFCDLGQNTYLDWGGKALLAKLLGWQATTGGWGICYSCRSM